MLSAQHVAELITCCSGPRVSTLVAIAVSLRFPHEGDNEALTPLLLLAGVTFIQGRAASKEEPREARSRQIPIDR